MDESRVIPASDAARLDALNRYTMQVREGQRRGREALRTIGKALRRIYDEELWREKYESFSEYTETEFGMDRFAALRAMQATNALLTLEGAGIETIPDVEAHLVLLNRIPQEELPNAWRQILETLREADLHPSVNNIKKFVLAALKQSEEEKPKGVNPPITLRRTFTEQGELALERIGRLAGKEVRQAIENSTVSISEDDLILWSDQDDDTLKNLAHYIIHQRWSLRKAMQYEEQLITESTTLSALATLAAARGGTYGTEIWINETEWGVSIKRAG